MATYKIVESGDDFVYCVVDDGFGQMVYGEQAKTIAGIEGRINQTLVEMGMPELSVEEAVSQAIETKESRELVNVAEMK